MADALEIKFDEKRLDDIRKLLRDSKRDAEGD